jgi:hypothetical protein
VRRQRDRIDRATHTDRPLDFGATRSPVAIVPMRRWDATTRKALQFATGFASEVIAVQVLTDDRAGDDLAQRWQELIGMSAQRMEFGPPKLVVLRSKYRHWSIAGVRGSSS